MFRSFLDYYKAVVSFIEGAIIINLGLIFRVLAFKNNI